MFTNPSPTMLTSEPTFRGSADNVFYPDGNTALSRPSNWRNDCGCSHNDAGSNFKIQWIKKHGKPKNGEAQATPNVASAPALSEDEKFNQQLATLSGGSSETTGSIMLVPILIIAGAGLLFTGLYFTIRAPKTQPA